MPRIDDEYIRRMEDILDLYAEPFDPTRPVVCFDELPYRLRDHVRAPLPMAPGRTARVDYEYKRCGTCNLFVIVQPRACWRHVVVTARRTSQDFAHQMKALVDVHFPKAAKIRVVLDNLNTHTPAALYGTFDASEAERILAKLEFHYTPKHASWLNMAEIEISVLAGQCLDQRLPTLEAVDHQVAAWEHTRNQHGIGINWRFNKHDARVECPELYLSRSE